MAMAITSPGSVMPTGTALLREAAVLTPVPSLGALHQRLMQSSGRKRRTAARAVQQHGRAQEAVQHAAELREIGQGAFLLQPEGVGAALISQQIVTRGD